jgi:hypothetical protein
MVRRIRRLWSAEGGLALGRGTQDATTWRINNAGRGRVESDLPMKTKNAFRLPRGPSGSFRLLIGRIGFGSRAAR